MTELLEHQHQKQRKRKISEAVARPVHGPGDPPGPLGPARKFGIFGPNFFGPNVNWAFFQNPNIKWAGLKS